MSAESTPLPDALLRDMDAALCLGAQARTAMEGARTMRTAIQRDLALSGELLREGYSYAYTLAEGDPLLEDGHRLVGHTPAEYAGKIVLGSQLEFPDLEEERPNLLRFYPDFFVYHDLLGQQWRPPLIAVGINMDAIKAKRLERVNRAQRRVYLSEDHVTDHRALLVRGTTST